MIQLLTTKIDERTSPADLERIRANLFDVIRELQQQRAPRVLREGLVLADGVATPIAHGLGRRALVWHSPPRGAVTSGHIEEVRDGSYDPKAYVVFKASGWGASITVDVFVL